MQSEAESPKKRVVFILIGLALLGLVVFGVVWAKNRADQFAKDGQNQEVAAETSSQSPEATDDTKQADSQTQEGQVSGASTQEALEHENSIEIPAAGMRETLVVLFAVVILTFTVAKFLQSEVLNRKV